MVVAQVAYASANVLYKLAIKDGMSISVVTAYRHIFAAAFSLSLALVFERCINSPKEQAKVDTEDAFDIIFLWPIWSKMSKEYPSLRHHSSTALMTLMAAIQATVFALCVEKDWSQWKLGWSIRLLTPAFSGIVVSGLVVIVTSWCVRVRGPLYASVFNPLSLVIVAIFAPLVLDENLYIGSVIGAVLIVCGLYMVLWGKSKEMRRASHLAPSEKENFESTVAVGITTLDHDNSDSSHTNIETMVSR
ncbi:hypothetical protein Fmac_005016 [Flemingia macrophylla]|uniref:WAT1-related protein n=1 Tax=Flemingia macrophylla TaxID=520843 RepID=A0ABD1N6L8_9FABA